MPGRKVIIGIHGLSNKPPGEILASRWESAIAEGLDLVGAGSEKFDFHMVYWADLMYDHPVEDDGRPLRRADPGTVKEYPDSWRDRLRARGRGVFGRGADWFRMRIPFGRITRRILRQRAADLAKYYDTKLQIKSRSGRMELTRTVLTHDLKVPLRSAAAENADIMVIAHSMGSIIAYDALRDLGRESGNAVEVPRFVTIGSPLGLATVRGQIREERRRRDEWADDPVVRTPTVVTGSWMNFADRDDKVAADYYLRDDYAANQLGVRVQDDLVANSYRNLDGRENQHKSYGYLRTPELSEHVADFLDS